MPPDAAPHRDAQRAASPRVLYPMRIPSTEKQVSSPAENFFDSVAG
jgi:hypothetical protein